MPMIRHYDERAEINALLLEQQTAKRGDDDFASRFV